MSMPRSSAFYLMLETDVWLVSPPPGFDRFVDRTEFAQRPDRLLEFRRAYDEEVLRVGLQAGIEVVGRRNGLLAFDFGSMASALVDDEDEASDSFETRVEATAQRITVMNAHLLCLHSTFLEFENVARRNMRVAGNDLIHVSDDDSGMGGPGLLRIPLGTGFETRELFRPQVISEVSLVHSLEKLDQLLLHPLSHATALVALLNEAHVAYQEHNYPLALVSSWTICEVMLNHRWSEYLDSRRIEASGDEEVVAIGKRRRKRLERSPDLTASIITEMLNLAKELPLERYELLSEARRGRNKWLHDLERPEVAAVQAALLSAVEMLEESLHMPLKISLGRSV